MIWDSSYWKEDSLALSGRITTKYRKSPFSEELAVELEKDIMIALYSIRKLEEARKLTSHTTRIELEVKSYKNLKNVTLLNWHKIDDLFDLNNPKNEKMQVNHFYNQIIHSYIFLISIDGTEAIDGFYFCSDRMRNKKLYHIELVEIEKFMSFVGNDYPINQSFDYDESIQDYKVNTNK